MSTMFGPNPAGLTPVTVTGTTQQMVPNTKYIASNASRITLTLPLSADLKIGDQVSVRGLGAGGWKVAQNANQTITGASATTTGAGGYIQSQTSSDTVALEYIATNTFQIISNRGTLDIV